MELDDLPDDIEELKDIISYQREMIIGLNEEVANLRHDLIMSQNEDLISSLKIKKSQPWKKK
mgnify:CR=1|tara:strand:- start:619 stop:804 length:186 start_codon:yes stop_codon:yes gene_type:complete